MPNHVRTAIKFKNLKQTDVEVILNRITSEMEDDFYPLNKIIDFDKIIPEPKTEEECPKECLMTERSLAEKYIDRPWFDWYAWRNKYWGTKWNAYDTYTQVTSTSILFVFSTAWSPATPIFNKLAELGYNMEIRWADEDYGYNCGKLIYKASEHTWQEWNDKDFKDSGRYARDIWRKY